MVISNLFFPVILLPEDVATRVFASREQRERFMFVDRRDLVTACYRDDEVYRERITEALEELMEYFLNSD